jgi:hypothetical protein
MAGGDDQRGGSDAVALGVYFAAVYDVIAATNSSPQTTEVNAKRRGPTLMKWVRIGEAQAGLFVFIATLAEPPGKKWRPIVGGGGGMLLLWFQYVHALKAGMASCEPGTEDYGSQAASVPGPPATVRYR